MTDLSLNARQLGVLLGLGDLQRPEAHHGYSNGCACAGCLEREERVRELEANPIHQPWMPKEMAA